MAIDIIISPLSKYWSGDYVTPIMQEAWDTGVDYNVVTPDGIKAIAKGASYGGEHAKKEREGIIQFVNQVMDAIPLGVSSESWNENDETFEFYRIDPESFDCVIAQANAQYTIKKTVFSRIFGKQGSTSHIGSSLIFLPVDFEAPYDLEGKVLGSLQRAKDEIANGSWGPQCEPALSEIKKAIEVALEFNSPLSIDM